jgi:lipoate-protein ligase A
MAWDQTMLHHGEMVECAFWRVYGWSEPAVTFGYGQGRDWVRQALAPFSGPCVRRPTGGGIVDHRDDLTYALSLPSTHPFFRRRATDIYQELHEGIARILEQSGFPATLAPCPGPACTGAFPPTAGICFRSPAPHDVIAPASGLKIAGAAMKRAREGILIQGSLSRRALPGFSHQQLAASLGGILAGWLELVEAGEAAALPFGQLRQAEDRFASAAWNGRR